MKYKIVILVILLINIFNVTIIGEKNIDKNYFIHRKKDKLVYGESDKKKFLRGICFSNRIWGLENRNYFVGHHDEKDYLRVKNMGMNVIRFYLTYEIFEDDHNPYRYKDSGWAWLDQNISWAKEYNIFLILDMHIPQGGYQPIGKGLDLWKNPEYQKRLIALWKEIAKRYHNETIIAGYDLLNEPVVDRSVDQWKDLSRKITNEIRKVDKNHLIIIEELIGVHENWKTYHNPNYTQFLINDDNVMYDFHFYYPPAYALQNDPWVGYGDGGSYPDEKEIIIPPDLKWEASGAITDKIEPGKTEWTYKERPLYKIKNKYTASKSMLVCNNLNKGKVFFDEMKVEEYDQDGKLLRVIFSNDIDTNDNWRIWSANNSGAFNYSKIKYKGRRSITVSGTTDYSACYNNTLYFIPVIGYQYKVSGWIKGINVPETAECLLKLDFEISPSGSKIYYRNKDYLEYMLNKYLEFGRKNNVPMIIGEFGLYRDCFKKNKGGILWVEDLISLLLKYDLNFTYHSYHEYAFGLYFNEDGLPDPKYVNKELVKLFKSSQLIEN